MKHIVLGGSLLAVLFFSGSCSKEPEGISAAEERAREEGKVRLSAGIVPSGDGITKAGPDAAVSIVYVLVFDENGYLVEYARAEDVVSGQGEDFRETAFSVELTGTSEPRRLHFICNYPLESVPFGSEYQLVGTLTSGGGDSAYWQVVEMPDGIEGDVVYPQLNRIPVVRNMASVRVLNEDDNFTLFGYKVVNTPREGSVAAWMPGGPFTGYRTEAAPVYANLHDAGYVGTDPAGNAGLYSTSWTTGTTYVYEHPYTGNAATYTHILLHGQLEGVNRESYYKVDIVRRSDSGSGNEYMDILRNLRYTFTIESMGSSGYATEEEAESHAAGNNISGSVDTESLGNMSDGVSQIFISHTEITITSGDPVTFRYKYIPDIIGASSVTANGTVTIDAPSGAVLASSAQVASSDDAGGWRTVTLRPRTPDGVVYHQTIRLTTPSGLSKTITLRLRPKYEMSVSVSPGSVDQVTNTPLSVTVSLPEGLPESFFPLEMIFSTDKGTIYPDPAETPLPVTIDTGRYGFLYRLQWREYLDGDGVFECHFLTNRPKSAAQVQVSNSHFETGTASFVNNPRYVTSFTIPAKSLIVTGLRYSYDSCYLCYSQSTSNRVNNTTYRLYPYGFADATTVTVNRMLSTDLIYFYDTNRRTYRGISIEDLEEGGSTLAVN